MAAIDVTGLRSVAGLADPRGESQLVRKNNSKGNVKETAKKIKQAAVLKEVELDVQSNAIVAIAERSAKEKKVHLFEQVYSVISDDFDRHGRAVVERVREENPAAYLKLVTSLLPKEAALSFSIEYDPAKELEELRRRGDKPREKVINGEASIIDEE